MKHSSSERSTRGVAVVTGAGSGIGRAIATSLAETCGQVIVVGRNRSRLRSTVADIKRHGARCRGIFADLATTQSLSSVIRVIRLHCEGIDVLVHCAGVFAAEPMKASAFDALFATNVRAPWMMTRRLLPLLERRSGQVVFVNSSAVLSTDSGLGPYAASKAALRTVAEVLRTEVNALGIRVLSVYPGRTATPMQRRIHEMEGRTYLPESLLQPSDVSASVLAALALPRTAEVTDLFIRPNRKPGFPAKKRRRRRPAGNAR